MKKIMFWMLCGNLSLLPQSYATLWNLSDQNSSITISDDTIQGAYLWGVDSLIQVAAGNFWYREGATGGESFLGTIGPVSSSKPTADFLTLTYDLGNFTLQADYQLQGGTVGSMESRFFQTVTVSNSSVASLELNLFQEWKFLTAPRTNNTLSISGGNRTLYVDEGFVGESIYSETATHFEALAGSLITELANGTPTTFSDFSGPVGPGVVDSGFQWDLNLAPGETFEVSIEHHVFVIPEPSTLILMMIAGLGCWAVRKRTYRIKYS